LVLLAITALAAMALQAQPNFTGKWKMNAEKSDHGEFGPSAMTQDVTQEGSSLKVAATMTTPMGEMTMESNYVIGGDETVNQMGFGEITSTAKWDGDTLVIEGKGSMGGGEMTMVEKWSLSEDGKTLTVDRTSSSDMGEMQQKIVLDKQ
jgi:hypothetical protein